jgi:RNA polymerase sigma-32 factor
LSGRRALLCNALKQLSRRERHIIVKRWLKDETTTLGGLSQHYGVSHERVRQIETHGLQELRKSMKAHGTHAALM